MRKTYFSIIFTLCSVFAFISCDKDKTGPLFKATPTRNEAGAGEALPYSIDASGINKITKLKIDENYNGSTKTILDSTFNPAKSGVMFAYNYMVPQQATKGQEIKLTFTITDEKGNTATENESFVVSHSRANIKLTADKSIAKPGETVNFTAEFITPVANLDSLAILESINNNMGTVLRHQRFPENTGNMNYTYAYTVPATLVTGDIAVVIFQLYNKDGGLTTASKRIDIKE